MKKGIYFILILIGLASCSQDVTFNNDAAFQGAKDNVLWKAAEAKATVGTNSSLNFEAVTINDKILLKVPLPATLVYQKEESTYITYKLGESDIQKASYISNLNTVVTSFQTGFGLGDGEVVITDYDGVTISGTFRFNAINDDETSDKESVNLQNGVFYKVPITP